MKPDLRLVEKRSDVDSETVGALENLLEMAKNGQLIGLAYAAVHTDHGYDVGITGHAARCPTYARGQLRALDDLLKDLVD